MKYLMQNLATTCVATGMPTESRLTDSEETRNSRNHPEQSGTIGSRQAVIDKTAKRGLSEV